MILETINLNFPFILIEDSFDSSADHVIKDIVTKSTAPNIHLHCYEKHANHWKRIHNVSKNVYHHDCMFKTDKSARETFEGKGNIIIIDSLNQMSLLIGWQNCLRRLADFIGDPTIMKVVGILHLDGLNCGNKMKTHLEHIASVIVDLNLSSHRDKLLLNMRYKKGGKIIKASEEIHYDNKIGKLLSSPVSLDTSKKMVVQNDAVLPHAVASFKIGLEDSEKIARDNLQLPYTIASKTGESRVYYDHDAADDWDDEDPDDDLDI